MTGRITCPLCGKAKPQLVAVKEERLVIEVWSDDDKHRRKIGTTHSIHTLNEWWAKAFSNEYLPTPDYHDEIRVYGETTRQLVKTYRLGWIEVERVNQTSYKEEDEGTVIEGKKDLIQ